MKKVVWGVLSTAKIGLKRALPGMLMSELLEVRAIARERLLPATQRVGDPTPEVAYFTVHNLVRN